MFSFLSERTTNHGQNHSFLSECAIVGARRALYLCTIKNNQTHIEYERHKDTTNNLADAGKEQIRLSKRLRLLPVFFSCRSRDYHSRKLFCLLSRFGNKLRGEERTDTIGIRIGKGFCHNPNDKKYNEYENSKINLLHR